MRLDELEFTFGGWVARRILGKELDGRWPIGRRPGPICNECTKSGRAFEAPGARRSAEQVSGKREIAPDEIAGEREVAERAQRIGIVLLRGLGQQAETFLNASCVQQGSGVMNIDH